MNCHLFCPINNLQVRCFAAGQRGNMHSNNGLCEFILEREREKKSLCLARRKKQMNAEKSKQRVSFSEYLNKKEACGFEGAPV